MGGVVPWAVNDFYERLQTVVGKRKAPSIGNYYRYGDTRHIVSDIGKLKRLGWVPENDIEKSIQDYWTYLEQADRKEEIFDYAQKNMRKLNVIRKIKEN